MDGTNRITELEGRMEWLRGRGASDYRDGLNSTATTISGTVAELRTGAAELVQEGHSVVWTIRDTGQAFRMVLASENGRLTTRQADGQWEQVISGADADEVADAAAAARHAAEDDDIPKLLAICENIASKLEVTLENDPAVSNVHWVRDAAALTAALEGDDWPWTLAELLDDAVPQRVVVHEGSDAYLTAPGLVVHGRNHPVEAPAEYPEAVRSDLAAADSYAVRWHGEKRVHLPTPIAIAGATGCGMDHLQEILARLSQVLAWLWIAPEAEVEGGRVTIRFPGLPDLDLTATPTAEGPFSATTEREADALQLWRFATLTDDGLRREALEQAVAIGVRTTADVGTMAASVASRGRFLLKLAQQGQVAEAMASMRAARQAAIDAASSIATSTRTATRSVVERVFTQVVSAFGIVLANQGDLVSDDVALWLLVVVLGLGVATLLLALYDYSGVIALRNASVADLDRYGDTVPEDDLDAIKKMESLVAADTQMTRAYWLTGAVLAIGIGLTVLALVFGRGSGTNTAEPSDPDSATTLVGDGPEAQELAPSSRDTRCRQMPLQSAGCH